MRADRLVSIVLMLRQRGHLTASALARELEVSERTILRDIDALSTAGVPVYAERGRHGGYALMPGFRTELTGLNHDETIALLTSGSGHGQHIFGLGSSLASALRKVVDALPESHQASANHATQRLLIDPESDLLARPIARPEVPEAIMQIVRQAVLEGRKLRMCYAATDQEEKWRTVDPVGLVTVRDRGYLLAFKDGKDRTYRLARVSAVEILDEPADRPANVELDKLWQQRSRMFRTSGDQEIVALRLHPAQRETLAATVLAIHSEYADADGWLHLTVAFQDARHAIWATWQLGTDGEIITPSWLRDELRSRASRLVTQYEFVECAR